MCQEIRHKTIEIHNLCIEAHKKYTKKTTLSNLDIAHEQLRSLWYTFWKLGYFAYKDNRKGKNIDPMKRYLVISTIVDQIGQMIGGWIRADKARMEK